MIAAGTLALPAMHAAIPAVLTLRQSSRIDQPLAIALLEANMITDAMLQPRPKMPLVDVFRGPDERALCIQGLSTWWNSIQYQSISSIFHWNLHVQALDDHAGTHPELAGHVWFCLTRGQNTEIPRFELHQRITQLENTLPGFGQTVMALLRDAIFHLPTAFDLWFAEDVARNWLWQDATCDEELLENARLDGGFDTIQEVLDSGHVTTRADFYRDTPGWVMTPRRILSRKKIQRAVKSEFELAVISACDAISEVASAPGFTVESHQVGAHQAGCESIEGAAVLLWRQDSEAVHVIDNYLDDLGNSGEYTEFIDAVPVEPSRAGILAYKTRTENIMRLAQATERLLNLVGEPF
nr:PRTRC system protein F [uncultured Janthinobacterium sp.]